MVDFPLTLISSTKGGEDSFYANGDLDYSFSPNGLEFDYYPDSTSIFDNLNATTTPHLFNLFPRGRED